MSASTSASASTPAPTPAVSVLGLGMMGSALAAALLKAGYRTTVWNRSAAKTGPLVAQGALPADSAAAAVAASPLVIVCLTTYDNVHQVLDHADLTDLTDLPDLTGKTIVNVTNGTPAQAREFATAATQCGAAYIDGGIMAVPQMIGVPDSGAYILYSGDEQAYQTHRATLAAMAEPQWTGTDPGFAALQDVALLTGMYGMMIGTMQAFALVRSAGIPAEEFAERLAAWVGAMLASVPPDAAAIDAGEHLTDVSSLAVNQAAFPNLLRTYADQGLSTELFEPFQKLLDRAVAEGHASDGLSRLADLIQKP
ncbi:NAD(P)-dependent oxidoreductase [Streptomyces apocyni]|uniref:NAD(P)-dependent oxidoreductase n=1 Tax=Streptomyces apocyni TaxID=2654677 RepID=UPI0012E998D2|nr:NAD(P)-binding domain-containing protein [Streptomyces apocyni]